MFERHAFGVVFNLVGALHGACPAHEVRAFSRGVSSAARGSGGCAAERPPPPAPHAPPPSLLSSSFLLRSRGLALLLGRGRADAAGDQQGAARVQGGHAAHGRRGAPLRVRGDARAPRGRPRDAADGHPPRGPRVAQRRVLYHEPHEPRSGVPAARGRGERCPRARNAPPGGERGNAGEANARRSLIAASPTPTSLAACRASPTRARRTPNTLSTARTSSACTPSRAARRRTRTRPRPAPAPAPAPRRRGLDRARDVDRRDPPVRPGRRARRGRGRRRRRRAARRRRGRGGGARPDHAQHAAVLRVPASSRRQKTGEGAGGEGALAGMKLRPSRAARGRARSRSHVAVAPPGKLGVACSTRSSAGRR